MPSDPCPEAVHTAALACRSTVADAQAVRRDCRCPVANHKHGTDRAYVADECRCTQCRRAFSRIQKARRHRQHLNMVAFVPPNGTARRLQALAVVGWSAVDLAALLHTQQPDVVKWRLGKRRISVKVAARVAAVYDRVWDQPPPGRYSVKVRNLAERHGWLSPLAWDDDTIDDPGATPFTKDVHPDGKTKMNMALLIDKMPTPDSLDEIAVERAMRGDPVPLTSPETSAAITRLAAMRMTDAEIAERLHMTTTAVCQRRLRGGIESRVAVAGRWRAVA